MHELDDVWLGSGNRPGAVVPPSWFKFGEFRQNPASDKKFRQNLCTADFRTKSKQIFSFPLDHQTTGGRAGGCLAEKGRGAQKLELLVLLRMLGDFC